MRYINLLPIIIIMFHHFVLLQSPHQRVSVVLSGQISSTCLSSDPSSNDIPVALVSRQTPVSGDGGRTLSAQISIATRALNRDEGTRREGP